MRDRSPSFQTRAILEALLRQPAEWRHGYDLAKLVGLGSGTLYPILIRLHDRGLLDARWTDPERPGRPARHAYPLSAQGVAYARRFGERPTAEARPAPEALA